MWLYHRSVDSTTATVFLVFHHSTRQNEPQPLWLCLFSLTQLCYLPLSLFFFVSTDRVSVQSGGGTTTQQFSGFPHVLFPAWPPSSPRASRTSGSPARGTRPPSSATTLTAGRRPTARTLLCLRRAATRCARASLWKPRMWLPPDLWPQMREYHHCFPGAGVTDCLFSPLGAAWSLKRTNLWFLL